MSYSPNMPPSRLSGAIAWASREFQKIKLTFDELVHILAGADDEGATLYWNGEKWIDTNAVSIDPAGTVDLYHNGSLHARTAGGGGMELQASSGNTHLWFQNSAGTKVGLLYASIAAGEMTLRNYVAGGDINIQPRNAADTAHEDGVVIRAEGSVDLYHAGSSVLSTRSTGAEVDSSAGIPTLAFLASGTQIGQLFGNTGNSKFIFRNEQAAGLVEFQGAPTGGGLVAIAQFHPDSGVLLQGATGGFKGNGTINAQAVYDDNTLLTDYVFDAALDGRIDVETWDDKVPDRVDEEGNVERRKHLPARDFQGRMVELDPSIYAASWRRSRKLPAFARGEEQKSVGDIVQRLIETCEVQAVHIEKLRQRIEVLEQNNV